MLVKGKILLGKKVIKDLEFLFNSLKEGLFNTIKETFKFKKEITIKIKEENILVEMLVMQQLNDTLKIKVKRSFISPPKGSDFSDQKNIKKNLNRFFFC